MKNILIPFLLILLLNHHAVTQHEVGKYPLPGISDPLIPLITNRLVDTLDHNWYVLKNKIDHRNSLKFFLAEANNDSIHCARAGEQDFIDLLAGAGHNWLLLVHGDSKIPVDAALRGIDIQNLHGVKVMVFSWPSKMETHNGLRNFKNSRQNVEEGIVQFRELLLMLQRFRASDLWPEGNRLSMLLHSLGNYYLEVAAGTGMLSGLEPGLFDNIIINAAAVDQEGHAQWLEKIDISKRIYVISNKDDFNLRGARLFTSAGKQLGSAADPPLAGNAIYVDFSKAVGLRLPTYVSHTYFVGTIPQKSDNIKRFYSLIFNGEEADLNDNGMFVPGGDGLSRVILF